MTLGQYSSIALGCRVVSVWFDLHAKPQLNQMLHALITQRPVLIWARLHGPCIGSGPGNRHDNSRALNVSQVLHRQRALNGGVVLEANQRSHAWHLQAFKSFLEGCEVTGYRACRYCEPPCPLVTQIVTNIALTSRSDCCCHPNTKHAHP